VTPIKVFIASLALLLVGLVVGGLVMDATWSVARATELDAPPQVVFPYVNELAGWEAWTPWGEVEDTLSGPPAGVGATRRWNDRAWGQGEWSIVASDPPRHVAYEVHVEDGSLQTRGELRLEGLPGARTRLTWIERGDFGWNPLLAWMARGMDRMQGREMEKSLGTLREVLAGAPASPGG
jgi:hypothetical protein